MGIKLRKCQSSSEGFRNISSSEIKTLEHSSPLNFPFCLQSEKLACTFFLLLLFAEKAKLSKALLHSVQNSRDKSGITASLVFLVFIVNSWCKNNRNACNIKVNAETISSPFFRHSILRCLLLLQTHKPVIKFKISFPEFK